MVVPMMNIGERLYYWRSLNQLSIYKLSKLSDVSENHIRNLKNGIKQPTIKILQQLTDSLGISLSEFFNDNPDQNTYLTEDEKHLLDLYRKLPCDKANILVEFYEKMCR